MSSTTRRRTGLSLSKASSPLAGCSTDAKKSLDALSPSHHNHGILPSGSGLSPQEANKCHASSEPTSRLDSESHNSEGTKETRQLSKKSPRPSRLLQVLQDVDVSEAPKRQQGESQEATTSTSPVCKSQSTPKRQEDVTAKPTTPTDNILDLEDECSPIQMFPGTQAPRLVHWDWRAYSSPNSTTPRKRVASKRRKQEESSCAEVMPPPRRRPRYQRSALSAELTPLEIELTAIRNKMLASGAYDHLLEPNQREKRPEPDTFASMYGESSTSNLQVFVETPGTESLLCPALTQTPDPSNISQAQTSVKNTKSSPMKKLSNTKPKRLKSDCASSKAQRETTESFATLVEKEVPVDHHNKTGDSNRQNTPTKQIIQRQSIKPVLIEKNLDNNNSKKSSTLEVADLGKNMNVEETTPDDEKKLNVSPEKNALFIDDSLNDVLIACSMQVEEECRLSQKQNEIPKPESSTVNPNSTAQQVLRNNQSDKPSKIVGPNNSVKNSHNFVSSFLPRTSAQIFSAPAVNGSSKNISSSSFKTILPTRKSPRIQSQSQKVPFKISVSPARKMPVVCVSRSGTDFSPKWVENLKIATSPLNCAPSTRSMSQRAFMKPVSPHKAPDIRKGPENKNISRTLFSKVIPHTKPSSSNSKSVTVKNAESEKPAPKESDSSSKKHVDLNRSHDPFGDSMDFTDLGEIDQIEATFQQQSQSAEVIPVESKNNLASKKTQSGTSLMRSVTAPAVPCYTRQETKLEVKKISVPVKTNNLTSNVVTIDLTDSDDTQRSSKLNIGNKMPNTEESKNCAPASGQPQPSNKSQLQPSSNSHPYLSNPELKKSIPTSQTAQLGSQRGVPVSRSISSVCSSLSTTENQTSGRLGASSSCKLTSAPQNTLTATLNKTCNSNVILSNVQSSGPPKTSNSNIMSSQHKPFNVSHRSESTYQQLDEILNSCNVNNKIVSQQRPRVASTSTPVICEPTVPPTKVSNNKPSVGGSPLTRHKSASDFTLKSATARHGPHLRSSPFVRHRSVGNFSLSQKYSAEDIERKRLEAQQRLQQRRLESQRRQK